MSDSWENVRTLQTIAYGIAYLEGDMRAKAEAYLREVVKGVSETMPIELLAELAKTVAAYRIKQLRQQLDN